MPSYQRHAAAFGLVVALTTSARADRVDPAAAEAADANTESPQAHSSVIPTFGVGGAITFGLGVKNAVGTGGAVVLRLAHVASRRSLAIAELTGAALFSHFCEDPDAETCMRVKYRTDTTTALAGMQYYVAPAFWLRMAAGAGSFHNDAILTRAAHRTFGAAGSIGVGLDAVALGHLQLGFELMSTSLVTRDGIVLATSAMFRLSLQ